MNIKALREAKNMSREDLASKVGVSGVSVYNWEIEKTKPHRNNLKRLKQILEGK